jgi:hypothetical protein
VPYSILSSVNLMLQFGSPQDEQYFREHKNDDRFGTYNPDRIPRTACKNGFPVNILISTAAGCKAVFLAELC